MSDEDVRSKSVVSLVVLCVLFLLVFPVVFVLAGESLFTLISLMGSDLPITIRIDYRLFLFPSFVVGTFLCFAIYVRVVRNHQRVIDVFIARESEEFEATHGLEYYDETD